MRSFLFSFAVLFAFGCGPSPLDRHVRAANDFRLVNDRAVPGFRALCSGTNRTVCADLTEAQHAFVDAHIVWVQALVREARAHHWRFPEDRPELREFCRAYHRLAIVARDANVPVPAVESSSLHVCEATP